MTPRRCVQDSQDIYRSQQASCDRSVGSGSAVVFADESAVFIMDSLRYTDYDVAVFLEGSMNFLEKFFYIEIGFRKINEKRIVSNVFPGKGSSSGEPAA